MGDLAVKPTEEAERERKGERERERIIRVSTLRNSIKICNMQIIRVCSMVPLFVGSFVVHKAWIFTFAFCPCFEWAVSDCVVIHPDAWAKFVCPPQVRLVKCYRATIQYNTMSQCC
jgi:hypothetical protein